MDHREGMPFGWPPDSVRRRPPPPLPEYLAPPPPELLTAQYPPAGLADPYRPPPGLYQPHQPVSSGPPPFGRLQQEQLTPTHYPPPLEPLFSGPPAERLLYPEEPHYLPMQEPPPLPPQQYLLPEELRRVRLQQGRLGPLCGPDGPLQRHLSSPAGLQSPLPPPPASFHASTPPPAVRFSPQLGPFAAEPVCDGEDEFGTARISDNLAAHLSQMEARQPQFEASPPPPPAAPPATGGQSFLSSLFGGWRGDVAAADAGLPVSFGVKPEEAPPSPPSTPAVEAVQEPALVEPTPAPATPEPAAASPAPDSAAEPARPSYSAVLAKPRPPPAPLASAQRSLETAATGGRSPAAAPRGQTARAGDSESGVSGGGGGGGGGGSRRGGRGGRRRRSSADTPAQAAAARGSPAGGTPVRHPPAAAADARPTQEPPPPLPQPPGRAPDTGKKKKRTGKTSRSESSEEPAAGRRAETLNNNPDRAQPTVQRRPLNYNNNLGSFSTLGPAQTHVHAPPPPAAAGDTAKKIDVNVGKQKNCSGKTSNESKKVEETMNKPDNKTLSQSRGSQPVNMLAPGGAAKSERVSKELAFRARTGRTGGRGRRDAAEPAGDLVRRLAAQLTPGLALVGALLAWLAHLVCDVTLMSSRLIGVLLLSVAQAGRLRACRAAGRARAALSARLAAARDWWRRPASAAATAGLAANIALPATGDDAMKRLLACKDKDPYSILGVTHGCSDADIKKYYKRQALLVHPDKSRSPGAEEAFKILRRAFELVGCPGQRAAFDAQAREQREVDLAFRQYTEELMTRLREKIEETQNTLRCNNCNQRHRRSRTQRPCYAARACATCKIQHAAREGDIWAESRWLGLLWRYYACMDGAVFDISEWAACQSQALKHLQANHHTVQYRIISGAKRHRQPADEPSDRDLEDILSNLYNNGSMAGEPAAGQRRRGGRRRAH